jgi:hypothetical protein
VEDIVSVYKLNRKVFDDKVVGAVVENIYLALEKLS